MFKSIPLLAKVGVLATAVLLLAAGPSQAQRGRAGFRGSMGMSRPFMSSFRGNMGMGNMGMRGMGGMSMGMSHPGMASSNRNSAGVHANTSGLRAGMSHFGSPAGHVTTPQMTTPQMNSPQMMMPQMVMPQSR